MVLLCFENTLCDSVFASLPLPPVLCSLAEEEIKTESDVVEGMDASARSKGKSPHVVVPHVCFPFLGASVISQYSRLPVPF